MNAVLILEIACAFSLTLFGVLLVFNKSRRNVGLLLLGFFLLLLGLHFFILIFETLYQEFEKFFDRYKILDIFLYSYGPQLFVITIHYVQDFKKIAPKSLYSFLIVLIPIVNTLNVLFYGNYIQVASSNIIIYGMLILFPSYNLALIKRTPANQSLKKFIAHINISFLSMIVIWVFVVLNRTQELIQDDYLKVLFLINLFYLIFGLAYFLIYKPQTLYNTKDFSLLVKSEKIPSSHFQNLPSKEQKRIKGQLIRLMEEEKIFLSTNLNLDQVALQLKVSTRVLSQLINTEFKTNFSDFVNRYRIEFSKGLLRDYTDSELNIKEVLFKSGFNSTSTFYFAFKNVTGLTPTEYRRQER